MLRKIQQRINNWRLRRCEVRITETISHLARNQKNPVLVQIGSNDGKTNDPFYQYIITHCWSALLVEPVPYVFERLLETHCDTPGVILENIAVSDREETKPFYHLQRSDKESAPWWYDQIGSFDRNQVLKSKKDIPNIEQLIASTPVLCMALVPLLEKHGIHKIDIIHTDLEGYDFQVLRQLDFSRWRPKLVLYEHKHLSPAEHTECARFLRENGYRIIVGPADTLAVDQRRR